VTIITGLYMGIPRQTIVKFSFLLAVPTVAAATLYDLLKTGAHITKNEFGLLAIGFICAFFVAILAMRFLLWYISENRALTNFGIYRILLAVVFFIFFIQYSA
jgi:undecaprenyl-diphosphatase